MLPLQPEKERIARQKVIYKPILIQKKAARIDGDNDNRNAMKPKL